MEKQRVLILGSSGMLGHTLFKTLLQDSKLTVFGSVRNISVISGSFTQKMLGQVIEGVDAERFETVLKTVTTLCPTVVINCIGVIKQLPEASDPLYTLPINSLFPHRLAKLCQQNGIRLIHISTDCVFDGAKGGYMEGDFVSATDLYGLSKYLGEVAGPGLITLRTSIVGHELASIYGLLEWFLAQNDRVTGFTRAIFSGLPTTEFCRIIRNFVLTDSSLEGLYHVSSNPISKDALLRLFATVYNKKVEIEPSNKFCCDRSLDSTRFREATGYVPPSWSEMIQVMHEDFVNSPLYIERRRLLK